jgi:hypothetical protein
VLGNLALPEKDDRHVVAAPRAGMQVFVNVDFGEAHVGAMAPTEASA